MSAAILLGLVAGAGAALLVYALAPAYPVLSDALARLDEHQARRQSWHLPTEDRPGWEEAARRVVLRAAWRLPISVPERDLRMLDWSRERYLLGRFSKTALYAAAGPGLLALLTLMQTPVPIIIPAGFMIVGGFAGWSSYARDVRDRAEDARQEMRYAVVAYLQQVGLCRAAGAGPKDALTRPADLLEGGSWAMRRIHQQLQLAELAQEQPWEGLRRFGNEVEVDELTDLSTIAETAGQDGGAVIDTLMARSASLHRELLAEEIADANRSSGRMSTPGALQVFLISAWVMYPAVAAVVSS